MANDNSTSGETGPFDRVPNEIISRILEFLDKRSLIKSMRVSKHWLNKTQYQRQDHIAACQYLSIKNPDRPQHPFMRARLKFSFDYPFSWSVAATGWS